MPALVNADLCFDCHEYSQKPSLHGFLTRSATIIAATSKLSIKGVATMKCAVASVLVLSLVSITVFGQTTNQRPKRGKSKIINPSTRPNLENLSGRSDS